MSEFKDLNVELRHYKNICENYKKTCKSLTAKLIDPNWKAFEESKISKAFKKARDYLVTNRKDITTRSVGLSICYQVKGFEIEKHYRDYDFKDIDYYWWLGDVNNIHRDNIYGEKLFQLASLLFEPKEEERDEN